MQGDYMKQYKLTVNETQLQAIQDACELMARVMIGQSNEIAQYLPLTNPMERWQVSRALNAVTKPLCGLAPNASYGVGSFEKADVLFDIMEVLRHQVAWDHAIETKLTKPDGKRDYSNMLNKDYDTPMHWANTVPLITIETITE
jgi:hypothetical protein